MTKNTLIVNLFGGPGSGKSTGATYIFSKLKLREIDCEYVGEFAKDKCWEGNKFIFSDVKNQFYIGAKQFYRINQVNGKVDVAITDSPLIMNAFYNHCDALGEEYNTVLRRLSESYRNLNFFIQRVKRYNPNGRNQNEEEAKEICDRLHRHLKDYGVRFTEVTGDEEGYDSIVRLVSTIIASQGLPH